jgi:nitronate monooxygenase
MGTAFLACQQSGAGELHRRLLLTGAGRSTGLTSGFTGRLARGFRNTMMDDWNAGPEDVLPYLLQLNEAESPRPQLGFQKCGFSE